METAIFRPQAPTESRLTRLCIFAILCGPLVANLFRIFSGTDAMHRKAGWIPLGGLFAVLLAGCLTPPAGKGKSPLQNAVMSNDSVAVEIFFIRLPEKDQPAANALWHEIDEQYLPAELRQRLAKNGFRVGVVGGAVPAALAKLMDLKETPPDLGQQQQATANQMEENKPRVLLRHLQARAMHRSEIIASEIYDQVPLLLSEAGELRGQTYLQAQGIFALRPARNRTAACNWTSCRNCTSTTLGNAGWAISPCGGWRPSGRGVPSRT